jgi:hypothetical protein
VDGVKSAGEWDNAAMTQFAAAAGWNVRVFAKHDAQYIHFDFEGVTHPGVRLFPEILVDPRNTKSVAWQEGLVAARFESFVRREWGAERSRAEGQVLVHAQQARLGRK